MDRDEAIAVLQHAGFSVVPHGEHWQVTPPPDPHSRLQREGAVLWEWVMIAVAKAVQYRSTPEAKMIAASRYN